MGMIYRLRKLWTEVRPPTPTFVEKDLTDLSGKVYLVTGGSSGIGLELSRILYHRGGRVFIAGRSEKAFLDAENDIKANPAKDLANAKKGTIEFVKIDLSDLTTVKSAATEILCKTDRLDVVWYNAGVMLPPVGSKTKQGYELQWGTNVVAHFLLNRFLSSVLIQTAALSAPGSVRAVWVSSSAHWWGPGPYGVNLDDPNYDKATKQPSVWHLYGQSKAGDILLAHEFAKRVGDKGIVSVSLNPGNLRTALQRNVGRFARFIANHLFLYPQRFGALTEMFAGLAPQVAKANGEFVIPWGRVADMSPDVKNGLETANTGKILWDILEKETEPYL
ncbi:hypothetical protein V1504DRAFT_463251 [Lipomyces starkeyi]